MTHNIDRCPSNSCELCELYAAGFARGKRAGRCEAFFMMDEAIRPAVKILADHNEHLTFGVSDLKSLKAEHELTEIDTGHAFYDHAYNARRQGKA